MISVRCADVHLLTTHTGHPAVDTQTWGKSNNSFPHKINQRWFVNHFCWILNSNRILLFFFHTFLCPVKAKLLDLLKSVAHMQWCQPSVVDHPKMKENTTFWWFFPHVQKGETGILLHPLCWRTWFHMGAWKNAACLASDRHQPGIQIRLAYPRGL